MNSVTIEGPESTSVDFVLGPYAADEAATVRARLERTLCEADPDFVIRIGAEITTDTTEVDVFEYFDCLDYMDPASIEASERTRPMPADTFSVSVEGPESLTADFVLGPYSADEAETVRARLERTLCEADPDFVIRTGPAAATDTTEVDVFEFFDCLDYMDPASQS